MDKLIIKKQIFSGKIFFFLFLKCKYFFKNVGINTEFRYCKYVIPISNSGSRFLKIDTEVSVLKFWFGIASSTHHLYIITNNSAKWGVPEKYVHKVLLSAFGHSIIRTLR